MKIEKMLTFIANNFKSICFRSMISFCWKSTLHRRRSYYYVFYATILIIFSLLLIIWFMILTQLSTTFNDTNPLSRNLAQDSSDESTPTTDLVSKLLDSYRSEIVRLQTEIEEMKKRQQKCSTVMDEVVKQVDHIRKGGVLSLSHEYEVVPFTHFTFTRIYPSSLALGKRVVEKPIGSKRKEIIDVLTEALKLLANFNRTVDDFIEGIYATDPIVGTQYHLYFRTSKKGPTASKFYHKVTLLRPFVQTRIATNEIISTQRETINLILPLSGQRLQHLTKFLDNIRKLSRSESGRLKLFIVYFGDLSALRHYCCDDILTGPNSSATNTNSKSNYSSQTTSKNTNSIAIKIIHLSNNSDDFSRAKALHLGADICCKNSSLLFFCDVDLLFTTKFLERCRLNASKAKKVYYPILFSLYNPEYSRIHVPNMSDDSNYPNLSNLISSESGFWRDFGFGMTCQYKHDFMSVGGFAEYLIANSDEINYSNKRLSQYLTQSKLSSGWGGEDVLLYRRHLQHPKLSVIRAIDPGIFHIWHQKYCDSNTLTDEQYSSCLSTRALNEASHSQLAHQIIQMKIKEKQSSN